MGSRWGCPVGRYINNLTLWREVRAGDKGLGIISVQVVAEATESVLSAKSSELRTAPGKIIRSW